MSWEIKIPNRGPDQPLDADALWELPRQLEGEDRLVLEDVLHRSVMAGIRTLRPILEGLEEMTTEERRRCLDACRRRVGLESTADVAAHERFEAANRALVHRRVSLEEPPPEERPYIAPGGAIVLPDRAEIEREKRRDERRAEQDRQRREERAREAREREATQRARDERWKQSGPGWVLS